MDLNNLINKIGIKQKEENKALDRYLENSNQIEKLDELLSEFFGIISDKSAPRTYDKEVKEYYNYIHKNINNSGFDIRNLNILVRDYLPVYDVIREDYETNAKFGLFLSALINKNIKNGEEIQLNLPIPVNYLFYKLENAKAHVNIAGDYLGNRAKNSKISTNLAEDYAGENIEGCELHVKKTGEYLGYGAKDSKIYAEEAGEFAGLDIEECELHVRKAGNYLGDSAKNSKIYADEAEYVAGSSMKDSELYIYKLEVELDESCLTGNNKVYLGKESYKKFPEYRRKVKIWKEKT